MVDRIGGGRGLIGLSSAYAATTVIFSVTLAFGIIWMSLISALAIGVFSPPAGAFLRSLWSRVAGSDDHLKRLHSLDSVMEEATFAVTPLVVVGITYLWSPEIATVLGGLVIFPSVLGLLAVECRYQATASVDRSSPGRVQHRSPRVLIAALAGPMLAFGATYGTLSIWVPAVAQRQGGFLPAGPLLALLSVGGIVGGLVDARLPHPRRLMRRYFLLMATFALPLTAAALTQNLFAIAAVLLIAGLSSTSIFTTAYLLVPRLVYEGRRTEMNSWIGSGFNAGSAVGALIAGAVLSQTSGVNGAWAVVGAAVAAPLCVALAALLVRVPANTPPTPGAAQPMPGAIASPVATTDANAGD
jgi:predicted MFS family arabinose efflux permease